jgi:chromosome segregation ATPase
VKTPIEALKAELEDLRDERDRARDELEEARDSEDRWRARAGKLALEVDRLHALLPRERRAL